MRDNTSRRGLLIVIVALAAMALTLPASAAPPTVVVDDTFTFGPEPNGVLSELCGFEIMHEGSETVRVTEFTDRDGEFKKAKIHVNGEIRYWTDSAVANEKFAVNVTDLADGSRTVTGSVWNLRAESGENLIRDAGRVVFDPSGDILSVAGPHEELLAEYGIDASGIADFCNYMAG